MSDDARWQEKGAPLFEQAKAEAHAEPGPGDLTRVKAKLREVRAALVGMPASVTESLPVDGDVQRSALEEAADSPSQKQ